MSLESARAEGIDAADALLAAVEAFKGRLSLRVQAIASQLITENGRIVQSADNIALVDALIGAMKADFVDDGLADSVIGYIDGLDAVTDDVAASFDDFGEIDTELLDAIAARYRNAVSAYLIDPSTYDSGLWQPIANSIIAGIATGAVLSDTLTSVNEQVGSGGLDSAVAQTVSSAPLTMQRAQTMAVADQVGAEFFLFQGRPIKTTREWCREREGRYWHRAEIEEWGAMAASGNGWDGMVDGTNEKTIFIHLGGWYGSRNSCRHVLVPVPRFRVPEEDLARMRDKGLIN